MAVRGISRRVSSLPPSGVAFGLAALVAALLSLAAALVGLRSNAVQTPQVSAVEELALRNERIAFFEARARNDSLDYISLNRLALEYLQRARETGDLGDYERAAFAAGQSLSILPNDNYNGLVASASVKLAQHDFTGALSMAEAALELKPAGPVGYGLVGDAQLALGHYDEARRAYQRMVDLEPALPALSRLAHSAFLEGDLANAKDFWRQALAAQDGLPIENRAWALVQLGNLHFSQGDLGQAEKQYRAALAAYPDYVHALAALAAVRAADGRWDEAIGLYTRVQERLPQPQHVAALGDVYLRAGRFEDAERQYTLVEAIDRLYRANGIDTDLELASFYVNHDRNLEEALAMARRAYEVAPGIYASDVYAWALFKNDRYEEAAARIEEALRLDTPEASIHYHAGLIYQRLGDDRQAIAHLTKAIDLNPHFSLIHGETARLMLAALKGTRR
jgi:tetratricopeptide (TPR) repeat protein